MRSLFVKFFFSFLLLITLIATAGILLTYLRDQEFPPLPHQHFARQAIAEYGRNAISAYEQGGIKAVDEYAGSLVDSSGVRIILFDRKGTPLTQLRVPRRMQHMANRVQQSGEVTFPMRGDRNWLASPLKSQDGTLYIISVGLPERPPAAQLVKGVTRGILGWQLLLLLLVTAVVCFFLARSFASPISRLRQATRQFAAGDLSIRVGEQVKGKNEIAGLASDFDHMAERIEDLVAAQKRLLRDISHELRSPLARLGVALELARKQEGTAAQEKSLQRIELEAGRMNEMIGQLLSLARLENDGSGQQKKEFDLSELLTRLVQDADFEARNRGCRVDLAAVAPLRFLGSEQLLARALENVIRNAVKYTAENSNVSVELNPVADEILIRILDQGPGVPEAALDKLFEPFYRVATARDRQSGGTGIGLAIAERAITLHKGRVKAANAPQGGLLVEISLPRDQN